MRELRQYVGLQLERFGLDFEGRSDSRSALFVLRGIRAGAKLLDTWCYDGLVARSFYEAALLRTRQLIPPLTIHTPDGRTVRAWDYKQKKNLVIAFLDTDCAPCAEFLRELAARSADLREKETAALIVFLQQPSRQATDSVPAEIIVGSDMPGRGAREFLGDDALAASGFARSGVFVTDRYGELSAQWPIERHKFPPMAEILSALDYVQMACDGCGTPLWSAE